MKNSSPHTSLVLEVRPPVGSKAWEALSQPMHVPALVRHLGRLKDWSLPLSGFSPGAQTCPLACASGAPQDQNVQESCLEEVACRALSP